MINLVSTSDKIQLTPSSTSALEVRVDFIEATLASGIIQADTFKPDNQRTAFSAASVADILTAPAANRVRNPQHITVRNTGATNPALNTVLVEAVNAAGNVDIFNVPLAVGEWLTWNETGVLFVYATDGSVKSSSGPGRYLRTNVLTSGTTYTTGADCSKIRVVLLAGGGAGGGAATVASGGGAGGGGSAGGYATKTFDVSPSTGYTYAIGAAGSPGAAGANAGGAGGDTTFAVGATTVTAKGGPGGTGMASGTTVLAALGGAPAAISTNGDVNGSGMPGNPGIRLSGTVGVSGAGGDAGTFGAGDAGRITQGNGAAGIGRGAGGSGGLTLNAGAATSGGAGTAGQVIVEEYA
jgi:hypothetical protein